MVTVDLDHPDIEAYINWKVVEEQKVAALVTDFDLNVLGEGVDVVVKPPPEALEQMDDFVRNMHTVSGLLEQLRQEL